MRKYTGLMAVVLVLLAAGLILTMNDANSSLRGRAKITEVYGKAIDEIEYRKLGYNSLNVIKTLKDPGLTEYALDLIFNQPVTDYRIMFGFYQQESNPREVQDFVTKRIVVAKTAAEYGIYPSTEQAKKHIMEKMFAKDAKFDAASYQEFIKNIGSSGLQEEEFVNLVAESLVYSRVKNIITSGLQEPNALTDRAIKFEQQTVDLTTVALDIETYKKEIKPTDEEIKTYWKENDFKYLTEREISVSYIVLKPEYSSPSPVAPVRAPEAKDEDFKILDTAYKAELLKWELAVEKPANNLIAKKIDDIAYKIDDSEGEKFQEEIESAGLKLTSTKLFNQKNAPEELKSMMSKNEQSIANYLFAVKISDSLKYRVPAPIKLEGNGYFYVRFDKEILPETKTFEQAMELAKADYILEKANAAMLADAKNVKEKLAKSITDGATAEEAAKVQNLKAEVRTGLVYTNLGRDEEGRLNPIEYSIFQKAVITNANSFSEKNVEEGNQVIFVYLKKKRSHQIC